MKLTIIQPYDVNRWYYVLIPSLGLGYLGAAAERAGCEVDFVDCLKLRYTDEQLFDRMKEFGPDVVGVTFHSSDYAAVDRYVKMFNELPKRPVVTLGGPHPTVEPRATLDEMRGVDTIFLGEAEETLPEYLKKIESGASTVEAARNTAGVAFMDGGEYIKNKRAPYVDVNRYPFPAWHLVEPESYPTTPIGIFSRRAKIAPMNATRGCRANCSYCAAGKLAGYRVRARDPENIVEEMKMLKDRGIEEIHFMDDSLTHDRGFIIELCEKMVDKGLKMPWASPNGVRLDTIDEEVVEKMEKAGCYAFSVGIESGTQRILDDMNKGLTVGLIKEKVGLIKKHSDIEVTGFFIIGYPGETIEDIKRTIKFSVSLPLNRANFFNFSPFPGSRIYTLMKRQGKLDGLDFSRLYVHQILYTPDDVSKEQLQKLQKKAYMKFYIRLKILLRLAAEIKSFSQIKTILKRVFYVMFLSKKEEQQPYTY
ncbi:MAG TPA: radical SAM protein [bacterium]|nr:radical SAM protein [bacterium]